MLAARARSVRGPYRDRLRAKIVLAAAAGQASAAIARERGVCADTVRKWRRRFAASRLPGLKDASRSGRPPVFTAADRAEVIALACALPAESGVPLSKWSGPDLARELAARRQLTVSASTIGRWLARDALKPWQHRSWISVRDPQFAVKAARVLDLYAGIWDGLPLGPDDYVICADEKTSIQARCRCRPTLPPGEDPGDAGRARLRPRRRAGLPGRLGRPPRTGHRPVRGHHRDRAVRPAGRAGDDHRAVRQRRPGVLDHRQRILAPRRRRGRADGQHLAGRARDSPCPRTPPGWTRRKSTSP